MGKKDYSEHLKEHWNSRASQDWMFFVRPSSDAEDFERSGETPARLIVEGFNQKELLNMNALDIGCGAGRLESYLHSNFKSIHGVDVSEEMVRVARERLHNTNNVTFSANSGSDLKELGDNSFDFVFSHAVFQHIPRSIVQDYWAEAFRVLKPNGIFRFEVLHLNTSILAYRFIRALKILFMYRWKKKFKNVPINLHREPPDSNTWDFRFYTRDELSQHLPTIGFIDIEISEWKPAPNSHWSDYWVTCRKPS